MNILYITNHLNIGGITSYILSLTGGLKRRGHNIYVASSGGFLLSGIIKEGAVFIKIPIKTKKEISPGIVLSMLKLSRLIRENKIDIIHANSRTTQVLSFLLSARTGVPYVSTCHGFFKRRLLRRIFPCWGRKVVAISESVKEHLINDFKLSPEEITVIHNGIDLENFKIQDPNFSRQSQDSDKSEKGRLRKEYGLGSGPVVGIVARLSDVKGHIYLIRAMKEVLADAPDAQLFIVGQGRMGPDLIRLTGSLGIEKNIIFAPQVYPAQKALSVMDIFVMPSLKEGFGLAVLEAMASGLAVIGTCVGGIKNLIKDNHNGILVNPADSHALALAISGLLKDGKKREFLGVQARSFVNEHFSQERMCLQTERVYLECLNAGYSA